MESTQAHAELTLLFTDIKDTVQFFGKLGDDRARELTRQHDRILCDCLETAGGRLVERVGDSIFGSFPDSTAAVRAAISMQESIHRWWEEVKDGFHFGIRIGLHRGPVIVEALHLAGGTVNIAARILGQADADEVVVSDSVHAGLPDGLVRGFDWFGPFHPKGATGVIGLHRWRAPWKRVRPRASEGPLAGTTMAHEPDLRESDWVFDHKADEYLLVGMTPEVQDLTLRIRGEMATVGRDPRCDFALDPARVANRIGRIHAAFVVSRRQLWVFDLGGKGGVILGYPDAGRSQRIVQRAPVPAGSVLQTGMTFWSVKVESSAPSATAGP